MSTTSVLLFPLALALAGTVPREDSSNEEKLAQAQSLAAAGQEDAAIDVLMTVDPGSAAMAHACERFKGLAATVARRSGEVCKKYVDAGQWSVAYERCFRAVELTCPSPTGADPEVAKLLKMAAQKLGKTEVPTCPTKYLRFWAPPPPSEAARISAQYPDPEVAQILLGYYEAGRPGAATARLKKLRSQKAGPSNLDELIAALESVEGRWVSFQELFNKGKREQCAALLKDAQEADAKVLPKGMQGYPIRQMAGLLAKGK